MHLQQKPVAAHLKEWVVLTALLWTHWTSKKKSYFQSLGNENQLRKNFLNWMTYSWLFWPMSTVHKTWRGSRGSPSMLRCRLGLETGGCIHSHHPWWQCQEHLRGQLFQYTCRIIPKCQKREETSQRSLTFSGWIRSRSWFSWLKVSIFNVPR